VLEKGVSNKTATDVETAIIAELRKHTELEDWGASSGRAGNIVTREKGFMVSSQEFDINNLQAVVQTAIDTWGQFKTYDTRGIGGGGNSFTCHFGNSRTHLFLRVEGRNDPDVKKNVIRIYINLVE